MKFRLDDHSADDLQRNFIIPSYSPKRRSRVQSGEWVEYSFELQAKEIGFVQLYHHYDEKLVRWVQYFPLSAHQTFNDFRDKKACEGTEEKASEHLLTRLS